ncbi:MAG: CvpA family protein [Oscillospiraceae bacterium]|nr:CvpA family protein [Oscillospiraceae bacterium]
MGTQFFWIFDIAIVAILAGFIFLGIRKGLVSTIVAAVSLVLAFIVSLPVSGAIADAIYENLIRNAVADEINNQIGAAIDGTLIAKIKDVDISKAKINGREFSSLDIQIDSSGKYSLDLSNLDLTGTGIEDIDLSALGITDESMDFSSVNLGTVVLTADDINTYGTEKIVLATVISDNISNGTAFGSIASAVEKMADSIPVILSGVSESVTSGDRTIMNEVVLSILDADTDDFARAITDDMVRPVLLVPMRALIFIVLFAIIAIILSIAAKLLKLVNKIPLIGNINKVLGAVAGAVEAVIVIFLVCIFIQVIVVLSGNTLIFLNTMTIDETFIFQKIYYFEFLDFLA